MRRTSRSAPVLGTRMGGLVSALYAMDANINHFEWAMLRIKDEAFTGKNGLMARLSGSSGDEKKLEQGLEQALGDRDLNQTKIPVKLAAELVNAGSVTIVERGSAREAVRAVMAVPGIFPPGSVNGTPAVAANRKKPFLISEAKALGIGPVVVFDVRSDGPASTAPASNDLKDADLVIRPKLRGIAPGDFNKKSEAVFSGKKAVNDRLEELRRIAGVGSRERAAP